jgi:poly(beta-D-mannuronate) lyase
MRFFTATCLIVSVALAGCGGGSTTSDTAATVVAEPAAPAANNAGSVTSMGNNQVGQTLTAVVTDLDGANGTISYQWFADGIAVAGASAETYDLTGADVNIDIRVRASYTDDNGFIESPLSDSNGPVFAASGLDPNVPPGQNFDLLGWYLSTPEENSSGLSTRITEVDLAGGYEHPDYFWTSDDGGMVFRVTNEGARTSTNTSYPRTELREMLRRGDTSIRTRSSDGTPTLNNWVFSSAPASAQAAAGAVDGQLKATLAVNAVTTSGSSGRVGRVIVGQIHAKDDEPIRLYYRKLPQNQRGSIYAAHEINGGDDIYYEIIGSRSNSLSDPADGITLNELWSYEILAQGNQLEVTIRSGDLYGEVIGTANIDMSASGYDIAKEFMYFKAGAYNQNNTSDGGLADDFSQVTFYHLEASHN